MIMDYFTVAALVLMSTAVYLVYRFKRRHRVRSIPFQRKRLSARKRRSYGLMDRDRGKVIPFPGSNRALQQNGIGQNGPNSEQNKK
jgi:hypothetical protein